MKIKAVIKEPRKPAIETMIDSSLKSLQKIVGGYIELIRIRDIDIYVNEEGLMMDLPYNITMRGVTLVGTIVATSFDDEGNVVGLNDDQVKDVMNILSEES